MPFSLELPVLYGTRGWKAKIRDRERVEPPHVTLLFKADAWRLDLRSGRFLDDDPPPRRVPPPLVAYLKTHHVWCTLCREWDRLYPHNPVPTDPTCDADDATPPDSD